MKKGRLSIMITGISLLIIILVAMGAVEVATQSKKDKLPLDLISGQEEVIVKIYDSQQSIYREGSQVPNAIYHFAKSKLPQLVEQMNFEAWKEDQGGVMYDMALSMVIQVSKDECYYMFPNVEGQTYIELMGMNQGKAENKRYFAPKEVYEEVSAYVALDGKLEQEEMKNSLTAEITEVEEESLLIKGLDEMALKSIGDACYLRIDKENTTLLDAEGKKVNVSYLKSGMQIKVELLGGVLESYPCQAEALRVQVIQ